MEDLIEAKLKQVSLPRRPKSFGEEYDFPEDSSLLSDQELGTLMFRLTAWQGYVLRELMLVEARKSVATYRYENRLRELVAGITGRYKTKDVILAEAHSKDATLKGLLQEANDAALERDLWKRISDIYEVQVQILSREVTRRAFEMKGYSRTKDIEG
jgi:hypothetical protein